MNEEWVTVDGVVKQGHQVASRMAQDSPYPRGTVEMQIPFFKERGLDLSSFFKGTLNISIHPYMFSLKSPEYTFRSVEWTSLHPPEDFSFSHCYVIIQNNEYEGLVYYPHPETKIRNFQDPSIIEVIAPP